MVRQLTKAFWFRTATLQSTTTPWQTSPNTSKQNKQKERTGLQENQFALILCINLICCHLRIPGMKSHANTQLFSFVRLFPLPRFHPVLSKFV